MFIKILFFLTTFNVFACSAQLSDALHLALPAKFKPQNSKKLTSAEKRKIIRFAHEYTWKSELNFDKELDQLALDLDREAEHSTDKSLRVMNYDAIVMYYNYYKDRKNDGGRWETYCDLVIKAGQNDTLYYKQVAFGHLSKGICRLEASQYEDAANKFQKALELYTLVNDTSGISMTHSNLQALYSSLYLFRESVNEQRLMLNYMTAEEKRNGLADFFRMENYQDRTLTYLLWFEMVKDSSLLDSAKIYLNKISFDVERGDRFRSYTHYLKGFMYYLKSEYRAALTSIDSSLAITDYYSETNAVKLVYRGLCLLKLGKQEEAKKVLIASQKLDLDFDLSKTIYGALYQDALTENNFKSALRYLELSKAYEDSAAVIRNRGTVLSIIQKYEVEEKNNQIVKLKLEKEIALSEKKTLTLAFIAIGIFLVVIIIVLYSVSRDRKLKTIAVNAELNREKRSKEDMLRLQEREIQRVRKKSLLNLRRQISRDLHDGLSSAIAGLKYYVNDLKNATNQPAEKELLEHVGQEVESVYIQARSYMHNLHTGIEEAVGNLNPFLRNIFQDLSRKNNIDIKFNYNKEEIESKLSLIQQNQLTLMLKEAMSNILKHADASKIEVDISFDNAVCRFSIIDNGRGFSKKSNNGIGMDSIQQRIRRIKGNVYIQSSSTGTKLSGDFPLNV